MTETAPAKRTPIIDGIWLYAQLPAAAQNLQAIAYVADMNSGCYMWSNGSEWRPVTNKRIESYTGTTDASGNYSVTYATPFPGTPNVQPVTYPPANSTTRVRVTASDVNGFTVKTETNAGVNLLGIDVLLLATSNVPGVPVRVAVIEA